MVSFLKKGVRILFLLFLGLFLFFILYEPKVKAPFHERYLMTPAGSIRMVTLGDPKKPCMVFVHGSPGSWSNFKKLMLLMTKDFYCVSYDRLGFGKSKKKGDFRSLNVHAETLECVVDEVADGQEMDKRIFLAGHSYGAPVAVQFALKRPGSCAGILLMGAALDAQQEDLKWYNHLLTQNWVRLLTPQSVENSNDELIPLEQELQKQNLGELKLPCLIIHGEKDGLVPVQNAYFAQSRIEGARLLTLPDEGHFIPWELPETVANAAREFFLN